MIRLQHTPSQTVGPFLHIALAWLDGADVVPEASPGALWLRGRVYDGAGAVVPDALVETWQADPHGRFDHPDDPRGAVTGPPGFRGFGRCATGPDGDWAIRTVKPGVVPTTGAQSQAPHVDVSVFARGLLDRVVTRLYFSDETDANEIIPSSAGVPAHRRGLSRNAPTMAITSTSDCRELARLSSSNSEPSAPEPGLLDAVYGSPATCEATSETAWLQAMLDVEAALAMAGAKVGVVPQGAATEIAAACRIERYDVAAIALGRRPTPRPWSSSYASFAPWSRPTRGTTCTLWPRARTSSTRRQCWSHVERWRHPSWMQAWSPQRWPPWRESTETRSRSVVRCSSTAR